MVRRSRKPACERTKSDDAPCPGVVKDFKQKTVFRVRQGGRQFASQKDFYDHVVRASEDYGAQVRYLLRNPVRWGLCRDWQEWPHKGVLGQTWEQLAVAIATL